MSIRQVAVAAAVLGGVLALVPAGVAGAKVRGSTNTFDARYCEVFELDKLPPKAEATVWNTLGLNDCPEARFRALDPAAIAKERGLAAVVLNGPRHFLMDEARAQTGGTHTFGGLEMREVARLPIATAADLVSKPYGERPVKRDNSWTWHKGRRVFELVAPGGDTYVMQSYALIEDPSLTLAKLPKLGAKLELPEGWKYRSRVLKRELTLTAKGGTTILQDDLQNTYQLATTSRDPTPPTPRRAQAVDLAGITKLVGGIGSDGSVHDRGTITGKPFGAGKVEIDGVLKDGRLTGTFRLVYAKGQITGTADLPFTLVDGKVDFRGVARITGGTGAFRGIRSGALDAHDTNTLDGQNGRVTVRGSATF